MNKNDIEHIKYALERLEAHNAEVIFSIERLRKTLFEVLKNE